MQTSAHPHRKSADYFAGNALSQLGQDPPEMDRNGCTLATETRRARDYYVQEALSYEKLLRARIRRYVGSHGPIADLLQETYVRLLQVGDANHAAIRSVRAFAQTVATNVALDWLRRERNPLVEFVPDTAISEVAYDTPSFDEIVDTARAIERISRVVGSLSVRRKEVFVLAKCYGCSHKEIAARLRIAPHTIENHLRFALRKVIGGRKSRPAVPLAGWSQPDLSQGRAGAYSTRFDASTIREIERRRD